MDEIQEFKNAIKSYHYHKSKIEYFFSRLKFYDELLSKVKSPMYGEPAGRGLSAIEIFDRQDKINQDIAFHQYQINRVDNFLKSLSEENKELIIRLYFKNELYDIVCLDVHMASTTLKKYINLLINNFLKKSLSH